MTDRIFEGDVSPTVYVPRPGTYAATMIAPGSGIVGTKKNGQIEIDYEGRLYGQVNMVRFADRVKHAHGRHATRYPTTARMTVKEETLIPIGVWHPHLGVVELPNDEPALTEAGRLLGEWLGYEGEWPINELRVSDR